MSDSTMTTLVRAVAAMLGLHVRYAQREAANDAGRVVGALMLVVAGAVLGLFGLLFAHLALMDHLTTLMPRSRAVLVVAGGDFSLAMMLLLVARARLRKPVLVETRAMVRRTMATLTEP